MTRFFIVCVLLVAAIHQGYSQRFTISGYVKEKGSGESLLGVSVGASLHNSGTATNNYGFYSITLPQTDSLEIVFSAIGYQTYSQKISLRSNLELDIFLDTESNTMEEVVVVAVQNEKVSETPQMSSIEIPVHQIKDIPALMGEKDVLKVIQLMPGVQKGSEGNSGIYVRGGGADQNLIILDDAVVYNAFHLFGFFSLFNGDALKSVELTKGGFPAKYGGRLSSVIEMNMKDGNKEKFHGQAGIGLISSRFTLEGPIIKNKSSFLITGRRSYLDLLLRPFMPQDEKAGYYFYDLNAKINYDISRKDKIFLSGYFGKDKFYLKDNYDNQKFETGMLWGNATGTFRWNHLYNERLFSNTSLIFSTYNFNIYTNDTYDDEYFKLDYYSRIRDYSIKHDLDFLPNPKHSIKTGIQTTYHRFTPSALVVKSNYVDDLRNNVNHVDVLESGIYIQDIYKPTEKIITNIGFRLSHFLVDGKSYVNPEPRLSLAYKLKPDLAIKGSYAIMNQYLHLLTNTGVGLPTDLWIPTTKKIRPQQSEQVAAGVAKDFNDKNFSITVEGYYKRSKNIVGYKEGSSFLFLGEVDENNTDPMSWEKNITSGRGWSYGAEFLIQKKVGKFSGWFGYTLSWTQLQFDSLNNGKKFYARYDRRHDISLVMIYKPSDKITFSSSWVYGTGNAITLPQSRYETPEHRVGMNRNNYYYGNNSKVEYTERNAFRMAPYHRLDFGVQFHKKQHWGGERTWEVSVYNIYNRKNPFFYFIDSQMNRSGTQSKSVLKQITLFPLIPSVTYSLKF